MRKHTFKATLCLVFFCNILLLAQQPNEVILDKIIAKVDNYIVLKSEYDVTLLQALHSGSKFDHKKTPCEVLENLLINKLLLAKAEIDSIVVDDKQVEAELDHRMSYFISQIGSKEKLEAYYNKSVNQLKNELRKQVKEQKVVQKMQMTITEKIKVTPGEVKKFFNDIPTDSLPFYSKEYELGQIVKLPSVNKIQKIKTRERLGRIRDMIVNQNESFAKMAKDFSEDPGGSARNGGEIGFFKKGDLVPEYEAAALKLKPGETSPIVESQFGFHIIQLIERRGNEFNTRHILLRPVSSENDVEEAAHFLDSLRNKIVKDSIKFDVAAKEHSDDKATKETGGMLSSQSTNSNKIPAEEIDANLVFLIDTLKIGGVSKPIPYRTEDGKDGYRIVYLKAATQPHQANLKDDYLKIQAEALNQKKNKAVEQWFFKTKNEVFIDLSDEHKDCEILKGM